MLAALYTDEDMSALVATLLKSRGLDVTIVPEQATLGKTDSEQLKFATSLGRCLLTHNRVDFEVKGRSGFPTMPNRLVEGIVQSLRFVCHQQFLIFEGIILEKPNPPRHNRFDGHDN